MPISGAEISLSGTEPTVTTDCQGRAEIGQLPAGAITGTVPADGYNNLPFSTTHETGTTGRVAVAMTPFFDGAMKVGPIVSPVANTIES